MSSDKFQVQIRVDDKEAFRAPSMVVYVMLCDEKHPRPKFAEDQPNSIEKWVVNDPEDHYEHLMRANRAKRIIVKPTDAQKRYTIEFTADKDLRKTAEVVAIAMFGDTSNYRNHHDGAEMAESPDREVYAFLLTPNSIKFLNEVEEED